MGRRFRFPRQIALAAGHEVELAGVAHASMDHQGTVNATPSVKEDTCIRYAALKEKES